MDASEYLAFVPLLLYGMALADLLGQWRRFFEKKYLYWPYFLTTVIFTELAIRNVFFYLEVVQKLDGISYFHYWLELTQPVIFLMVVSALTPDSAESDTKDYFEKRITTVFALFAAFIASHFLPAYGVTITMDFARVAAIVTCVSIAITRRAELIYVLAGLWFVGLLQLAIK